MIIRCQADQDEVLTIATVYKWTKSISNLRRRSSSVQPRCSSDHDQQQEKSQKKSYYGNQTLMVWSTLPEATTLINFSGSAVLASASAPFSLGSLPPPDEGCRPHARAATKCPCASTVLTHRAVASSQTRIVLSSEADNKNFPDG